MGLLVKLRATLGEAFNDFEALNNTERLLLCEVVSFGRKSSILCLL